MKKPSELPINSVISFRKPDHIEYVYVRDLPGSWNAVGLAHYWDLDEDMDALVEQSTEYKILALGLSTPLQDPTKP